MGLGKYKAADAASSRTERASAATTTTMVALGPQLASVETLATAGSDRPTSIRLLNSSIYTYIHMHELLDRALLAMHLALLGGNGNLSHPLSLFLSRSLSAADREGWRCPSDRGLAGSRCYITAVTPLPAQSERRLIPGIVKMTPALSRNVDTWV